MKDEDFRLSFLFGNFITATNLSRKDLERIGRLNLSPLYISVHATDEDVRKAMLGNPRARAIMPILAKLARLGISLHTQIVLCPGINDGDVLRKTIEDLSGLFPAVQSIAIVPVGLTKCRDGLPHLTPVSPDYASKMIEEIAPQQEEIARRLGKNVLFLSDEFYLLAGKRLPEALEYGEFEQIENGVGLVAKFRDEFDEAATALLGTRPSSSGRGGLSATLITGELAAPIIGRAIEHLNRSLGLELSILIVGNEFFGSQVTVAGLLTGRDIKRAVIDANLGRNQAIWVPEVALEDGPESGRDDERRFLDGTSLSQLSSALDLPVIATPSSGAEFARFLSDRI